jgi:hypothetical protein
MKGTPAVAGLLLLALVSGVAANFARNRVPA